MTTPRPATNRELRRLRWRITFLITLLATVAVVVFAVVAIRLDRNLRDEQLDAELLRLTTRTAGLVTFTDGDLDLTDAQPLDPDVIIGVRKPFDVFAIVEDQDLWDEIPEISDEEEAERIIEVVDGLDIVDMRGILEFDLGYEDADGFDREEMREILLDEVPEDLTNEAYRAFLLDVARDEGFDLAMATDIISDEPFGLDSPTAAFGVRLVADEDETDLFELDDTGLLVRGVPLRSGAEIRGAILAVGDPSFGDADHADFRQSLLLTGALLVLGSAIAAWLVAGRTIQPAARALAQQERFLSDAAHELRTPIAAIRATAETGADAPGEALDRVAVLAGGAAQLTDDLLTLARMDADRLTLEKQPTRLDLLVEALIDDDPAFVVDASESIVDCDPRLVQRAVDNLLRNARRHGQATANTPATVIVLDGMVRVTDRGPGIDPNVANELFERFRSSSRSSGHGLGLPLARWIAQAHDGDLVVVPTDNGASFELRLTSGHVGV